MKRISAFVLLLVIFFTMTTVAHASDSTDVPVDDHFSSSLELKKLGDVDGDETVTIIDATCIQRHLASIPTYAYIEKAADTDEDGEVTIIDATCIQRWLVDLPSNDRIGQLIREENSDSDEDFSFLNDKPVCPECGSKNVAYIIYGYPMPEEYYSAAFRQKLENGEITFGGCVIDLDSPKWQCNDCGFGIK